MITHILFDLDGTLTDPKEGITKCVQYALKSCGVEVLDLDRLTCFIGPPLQKAFQEFYGFDEEKSAFAVKKYTAARCRTYAEKPKKERCPFGCCNL